MLLKNIKQIVSLQYFRDNALFTLVLLKKEWIFRSQTNSGAGRKCLCGILNYGTIYLAVNGKKKRENIQSKLAIVLQRL